MQILADTHSHIYDSYNIADYLNSAFNNLSKYKPKAINFRYCLFLTQSSKHSPDIEALSGKLRQLVEFDYNYEDGFFIITKRSNGAVIYLIPGRQFISAERLEILALTYQGENLDGLEAGGILNKLSSHGIMPVLPWSPGKWTGSRGAIIGSLIENYPKFNFMLGDIPMRSGHNPKLFFKAREKNIRIINGSDTLPLKGEEFDAGSYLTIFEAPQNFEFDLKEIRKLLINNKFENAGDRNSYLKAFKRWLRVVTPGFGYKTDP